MRGLKKADRRAVLKMHLTVLHERTTIRDCIELELEVPTHNCFYGMQPCDIVIFVNENENENGEKRENNKFVNEN